MEDELIACSKKLLGPVLGLQEDDELGIVFDHRSDMVASLESVACDGAFSHRMLEIPRDRDHSSPVPDVAEELQACDAVVAPTEHSISHAPETTAARQEAGTRFLTLPGITEEIYRKIGDADVEEIDRLNEELHEQVRDAQLVTVSTPSGTNVTVTLDPSERSWHLDGMTVHESGGLANAPAGEIFVAPLENGANGRIVIDRWREISPEDGAWIELDGGTIVEHNDAASPLISTLEAAGPSGLVIAELGIGTNRSHERPIGNILHDEKIYGTCHIAFGMNTSMGGVNESSVHQDVVLENPDLSADGRPVTFPG